MIDLKKLQNNIGTLQESSLHATLKKWIEKPGDKLEEPYGNYLIDIVRDDLLIEIQTKNFSAIKKKIVNLIQHHKICLVHPISQDKWITNIDVQFNKIIRRRLSPLHRSYIDIFEELIRIPDLISHPNLTIEIYLVQTEEIRKNDGKGSWRRRGWSICDRKLIGVLGKKEFRNPYDFLDLIPKILDIPFTNLELAQALNRSIRLARKMSYCLRKMGILNVIGKKSKYLLYDF